MKFNVTAVLSVIIGVILIFTVVGETMGDMETAGDAINATSAPLGSFFASGGLMFLVFMAGIIYLTIKAVGIGGGR